MPDDLEQRARAEAVDLRRRGYVLNDSVVDYVTRRIMGFARSERARVLREAATAMEQVWREMPNTMDDGFRQNMNARGMRTARDWLRAAADREEQGDG